MVLIPNPVDVGPEGKALSFWKKDGRELIGNRARFGEGRYRGWELEDHLRSCKSLGQLVITSGLI
jgi:hypothetical protein